jgi:hypothetical protein
LQARLVGGIAAVGEAVKIGIDYSQQMKPVDGEGEGEKELRGKVKQS